MSNFSQKGVSISLEKTVKKYVTLRHVADHAGVSASTASLVLNGKGDISLATREKVQSAVSELNYSSRSQKTKFDTPPTIRFLKVSKHGQTVNTDHNHFITDYIDGMSREAMRRDYALEVVTYDSKDIEGLLTASQARDLSGVIILGTELSERDIIKLANCGQHVVFIDTCYPFLNANFVDMDNDQTVFTVVSYIKSANFSRIGFVGSHSEVTNLHLRGKAFQRACEKLSIDVKAHDSFTVEATRDGSYEQAKNYLANLKSFADAYFCVNDIVALGLVRALKDLGKSVPQDVSVIGFDNLPMSSLLSPSLTTIDVPKQQIGATAIRLLDDMIVSTVTQPAMKVMVSGKLILRESTISIEVD